MSRFRSIVCLASSCCLVVLAAAATIQMFPLEGRAHDANAPVQVAKGGEYLLHDTPIEYPQRALERKIEGDVLLEVTVNDQGLVSDARVLSGPEELRRVALESALQWHYSPAMPRPATTQALIRFRLPALVEGLGGRFYEFKNEKALFEVSEEAHLKARHLEWRMPEIQVKPKNPESPEAEKENLERQLVELKSYRLKPVDGVYSKQIVLSENPSIKEYHAKLLPDTAIVVFEGIDVEVHTDNERSLFREPVTLTKIRSERVSEAAMNLLSPRLGVRVGDTISEETAKEIEKLVQSIDEHFRVSFHSDDKGGVELVIVGP